MSQFNTLGLSQVIVSALDDLGYVEPTPIQQKTIPQILASKDDLKAFAQTGTGKTAAFSLPIIEQVNTNSKDTQAIILSPTRELAIQIGKNIEEFAKNITLNVTTVYGGANIEKSDQRIKKGCTDRGWNARKNR